MFSDSFTNTIQKIMFGDGLYQCLSNINVHFNQLKVLLQWMWVGPETAFLINYQAMLVKLPDMDHFEQQGPEKHLRH